MNLLITQRVVTDRHGEKNDSLERAYTVYFNSLGINLIPVSAFVNDIDELLSSIKYDGLIVTGGGDVDPSYNAGLEINPEACNYSPERQGLEEHLIKKMISEDKPILAICYGMQLVNCIFGGKLHFDYHKQDGTIRQPGKNHEIIMDSYAELNGKYKVNHYHNTVIRKDLLGTDLRAFAFDAEYDIVEGLIHKEYKILGVQWHPERPSPDTDLNVKIVKKFLFDKQE